MAPQSRDLSATTATTAVPRDRELATATTVTATTRPSSLERIYATPQPRPFILSYQNSFARLNCVQRHINTDAFMTTNQTYGVVLTHQMQNGSDIPLSNMPCNLRALFTITCSWPSTCESGRVPTRLVMFKSLWTNRRRTVNSPVAIGTRCSGDIWRNRKV